MERPRKTPEILTRMEGCYFKRTPDGICLLDPLTKEEYGPNAIPPTVARDDMCAEGLAYLADAGDRIVPSLVLTRHGDAVDFEDMQRHHEAVLLAAEVVCVEAQPEVFATANKLWSGVKLVDQAGRRDFQQAQLAWLSAREKVIVPCEYVPEIPTELATILDTLWGIYIMATQNKNEQLSSAERNEVCQIATLAHQKLRQSAIIARVGYLLSRLEAAGWQPDAVQKIPIIVGRWHEPTKHIYSNILGLSVEVHKTEHTAPDTNAELQYSKVLAEALPKGRMTYDQLRTILPY